MCIPQNRAIAAVMSKLIFPISAALGLSLLTLGSLANPTPADPADPTSPTAQSFPAPLAQTRLSPPVPPLPYPVPPARPPGDTGITGLIPAVTDDLGVGHLRPRDLSFLDAADWPDSPYLGANWLQAAAVPIYIEPNGIHWGWLMSGWLIPNGQPAIALGTDATFSMLHTYYALYSFPVTQMREDGWFQFQYTSAGSAWAHVDHLNLGRIDLTVETWEERFLAVGWVEFRRHGLSQPLREAPDDAGNSIVNLIGPNSIIEPLAFTGDWMQVRVTQPTDGCISLPGAATQEGWMRWRNAENQSLVWYPPQGC
ncbi:MAG TPA: hypothetical protein V6D02_07625 [Candidatus Obscuribacterales bacterium]